MQTIYILGMDIAYIRYERWCEKSQLKYYDISQISRMSLVIRMDLYLFNNKTCLTHSTVARTDWYLVEAITVDKLERLY